MSAELKKDFPNFGERSTEMARLWKIHKMNLAKRDDSDYSDNSNNELIYSAKHKKASKSSKAIKATKTTKAKKTTKGGFYENAYDYNFF
eukprot:gene13028-3489_t